MPPPLSQPPLSQPSSSTPSRWTVALDGARAILPMMPGIIPFALVSALAARDVMSLTEAMALSFFVFAGASQIAFAQLLGAGALAPIIFLTVVVINLRFVMYSATLAPHLRRESSWSRALAGYLMTDQAFAISINRFTSQKDQPHRIWFYLGAAVLLWVVWQAVTLTGLLVGKQLPPEWHLEFTVPLVFMVLLIPAVRDRPSAEAAIVSGITALVLSGLPYNLGLITAAVIGITWGVLAEQRQKRNANQRAKQETADSTPHPGAIPTETLPKEDAP